MIFITTPRPAPSRQSEYFKKLSKNNNGVPRIIELDGKPGVKEVSEELMKKLG